MRTRSALRGVAAVVALMAGAAAAQAQWVCRPIGPPVVIYGRPYIAPVPARPGRAPTLTRVPAASVPPGRLEVRPEVRPGVRPAAGFATPKPAVPTPTVPPRAAPVPADPPRIEIDTPGRSPVGPVKSPDRPANPLVIPLGPTETPTRPGPPPTIPPIAPGAGDGNTLPPLKLPTSPADSTSFARPPVGGRPLRVDVFPVARSADGAKSIGFFNTTDRELTGSIGGEAFRLPAGHWLTAEVAGGDFTWRFAGEPERTTTVPAGAGGVELIVRP